MHCDLKNFRLIQTKTHVIAVFRPDDTQGKHGVIPMMVFKGMKIPEAESALLHAESEEFFPISLDRKVGLFSSHRRSHMHIHAYDSMTPFTLFDPATQQMQGADQLDAINNICLYYPSIKDAVADMKPEFFIQKRGAVRGPNT